MDLYIALGTCINGKLSALNFVSLTIFESNFNCLYSVKKAIKMFGVRGYILTKLLSRNLCCKTFKGSFLTRHTNNFLNRLRSS